MAYPKGRPRKDLVGKRFGRLLVIRKTESTLHGNIVWECLCDCGNQRFVPTSSLNSGNTTSCGCLTKENQRSTVALPEGQAAFNRLFRQYKYNAKKAERVFTLTEKQFRKITSSNCFYCGCKPNNILKEAHFNGVYPYNGVDRQDTNKGYTVKNSVACCKTCNYAKHQMSVDEFYSWIKKVYEYS